MSGQTKSFYLARDVIEYLESHPNASAEVNRLVRRKIVQDAEAQAFQRINGVPLTEERRRRARTWAREQRAAADAHAAETREERDELHRQMGWVS